MSIRALLVDDEAIARRRMRRLLEAEPDIEVIAESADGEEAIAVIRRERPELVLLDVQMPELDGFGVIERLSAERLPCVIFVTAFDRYALQAFEVHAIDYLLKPFTAERFRLAISRARERMQLKHSDGSLARLVESLRPAGPFLSRLSVKSGGRIVLVDLASVDWIEAADNYVRLHCGTREHVVRETLAALERKLDPKTFVRIHRSAMVRVDRIREFHPATHGDMDVILRDGTQLTMSRTWRARARHLLGD